jgi:CheY-like chemotaxis protein
MHKVTSTKHVLVYCDDDKDDLSLVADALQPYKDSIELCLFERGYDAHKYLLQLEKRGEKPCLIILDMNMPGIAGRELLPIVRSIPFFDDVPVVLFTTSSSQNDYHFALQYNAGFITKPMTYKQMDIIAEQFLSHCSNNIREKIKRKA